jgi:hypothetical protein
MTAKNAPVKNEVSSFLGNLLSSGIHPDDIVAGKYYVARQPKSDETFVKGPKNWYHGMQEGVALKCASVVHRDSSVKLGDSGHIYNAAWLREATEEEIPEEDCVACKLGTCEVSNPDRNFSSIKYLPEEDVEEETEVEVETIFETAEDALQASLEMEYHTAAKAVAAKKAAIEVNTEALTPGMMVWHAFNNQPCVLIEKKDEAWTIERKNGDREYEVSPAILRITKPGILSRATTTAEGGWKIAKCLLLLTALVFSAGIVGFIKDHYILAGIISLVVSLSLGWMLLA